MSQHDVPHAVFAYGSAACSVSIEARVRPNLRLAYPVPPADHSDDKRFSALLDVLAQRTGHARQIARENAPAL